MINNFIRTMSFLSRVNCAFSSSLFVASEEEQDEAVASEEEQIEETSETGEVSAF